MTKILLFEAFSDLQRFRQELLFKVNQEIYKKDYVNKRLINFIVVSYFEGTIRWMRDFVVYFQQSKILKKNSKILSDLTLLCINLTDSKTSFNELKSFFVNGSIFQININNQQSFHGEKILAKFNDIVSFTKRTKKHADNFKSLSNFIEAIMDDRHVIAHGNDELLLPKIVGVSLRLYTEQIEYFFNEMENVILQISLEIKMW